MEKKKKWIAAYFGKGRHIRTLIDTFDSKDEAIKALANAGVQPENMRPRGVFVE